MATGVKFTTSEWMDFGTDTSLGPGAAALTLLMTIEPTADPASLRVIHRWASGEECFLVQGLGSGIIGFLVSGVGGLRGRQTDASAISSGVRTRLGFRWRADTGAMSIWVNGVSVAVSIWISDSSVATLNNSVTQMAICREDAEAADGVPGYYEKVALWESALSDADMLAYGTGTAPDALSGAPGQLYVKLTASTDVTDLFGSNTVTNHGGEWDTVTDPPNASYAPFTLLCEAAHANITPTNTGGAITSMTRTGGDAVPAGVAVGADGTITITAGSMLAAGIGSYDIIYTAANAAGSQTGVHITFTITANPTVAHYVGSPFVKYCGYTATTADITLDSGPTPATYAASGAPAGATFDTGGGGHVGRWTFNPTLAQRCRTTIATVTLTTTGGQVTTISVPMTFGFQFTARATNAGGSGDGLVTLFLGDTGSGEGGSIARGAFAESPFARSSFDRSAFGGGDPFR